MKSAHAAMLRAWLAAAVALAALAAAGATAALAQSGWWNGDYAARRGVTVTVPDRALPGDDAVIVTFMTGGRLKEDGSDIRVVARGRQIPHKLYGVGPGDSATIAFPVARDQRDYHVYFGNPAAAPIDSSWEPQRGLILETRSYNGGNPANLAGMRDILQRAGAFHGAGAVDRIWHGHNVFGPTDAFVSRYVGWLACGQAGSYAFATTSDDASFLLVNGRGVVEWPGWHGAVGDTRHNKSVNLAAGIHRLEYLHVSRGGTSIAVAAWKPPGAAEFQVIPAQQFVPLSRATVGAMELAGHRYAADFDAQIVGEALIAPEEERFAVRVAFAGRQPGAHAGVIDWDFGDGQTARGPVVSHVYLAEGVYPVRMTVGAGRSGEVVTHRIRVHRHWGWQTRKEIDDIASYTAEIGRYDVAKLDAASCVMLMELGEARGMPEFVRRGGLSIIARASEAGPERLREALGRLRRAMKIAGIAADDAVLAAYSRGFRETSGAARAALALELAEALFERGQPEEAAAFVKTALAEKTDERTGRRLFIAAGDAARYLGDAAAARHAYAAAHAVSLARTSVQEAAMAGGLALQVEDYLKHAQHDEAEAALDAWDWERPLEKMLGYSSYLRARTYLAQGRKSRALAELSAVAAVSPDGAHAPKALLLAAQVHMESRNREAARALLSRISADYPASPEASEAARMLGGTAGS